MSSATYDVIHSPDSSTTNFSYDNNNESSYGDCNSPVSYGYYSSSSSSVSVSTNASPTPEPESEDLKASNAQQINAKSTAPTAKKQYKCTKCLKNFSRPSALQTHSYTHTAEKPFQCSSPNCGRRFSVVSNLRRHFKVHQKPSTDNKLSSEDRLRCVRQLMKRSDALLLNRQRSIVTGPLILPATTNHRNATIQPSMSHNQQQGQQPQRNSDSGIQQSAHRSYQHYLILPSISSSTSNNTFSTQYNFPPITLVNTTFVDQNHHQPSSGDMNNSNNLIFSSMTELPLCWSSSHPDPSINDNPSLPSDPQSPREREIFMNTLPSNAYPSMEPFFFKPSSSSTIPKQR